jgi:CheY-like chemotaxis protein
MEPVSPSPGRILVVDDNLDLRDSLADLLDGLRYPVDRAANGLEALQFLDLSPLPSLVLLDWLMPVMNGETFLKHQSTNPCLATLPVVVITALADSPAGPEASAAVAVLPKPTDIEKLLHLVTRYCGPPAL